ncbi:MAG: hypothetical protein LBI33_02335 [Propionibacteriaceae bacterium]|jgi:hypothetical protein|nr:hypothetical protein [Propionibacteriaceae bacterium]
MRPLVFLDANVLAKPVTRTLLVYAGNLSGYDVAWSRHVEEEADRNRRPNQAPVRVAREAAQMEWSLAGVRADRYESTEPGDRQVVADAVAADAIFIITEDVDDFGLTDLVVAGMAAVNPDLFLSVRATDDGYAQAIRLMSAGMTNPCRTPEELHARLGRQHPLTTKAHRSVFDAKPLPPVNNPPGVLYRGQRCLACLGVREGLTAGVCDGCRESTEG